MQRRIAVECVLAWFVAIALPVECMGANRTDERDMGQRIFDGSCARCHGFDGFGHVIAGQGRGVGPELTRIGIARKPADLHQDLVAPAAASPEGGSFKPIDVEREAYGAVRALDAISGQLKWGFRIPSPPLAGVLSTGGGVIFSGTNEGNFFALDAENGKPLWDFNVGGGVRANPISYSVDGKQYVAISAGSVFFVFALP